MPIRFNKSPYGPIIAHTVSYGPIRSHKSPQGPIQCPYGPILCLVRPHNIWYKLSLCTPSRAQSFMKVIPAHSIVQYGTGMSTGQDYRYLTMGYYLCHLIFPTLTTFCFSSGFSYGNSLLISWLLYDYLELRIRPCNVFIHNLWYWEARL